MPHISVQTTALVRLRKIMAARCMQELRVPLNTLLILTRNAPVLHLFTFFLWCPNEKNFFVNSLAIVSIRDIKRLSADFMESFRLDGPTFE